MFICKQFSKESFHRHCSQVLKFLDFCNLWFPSSCKTVEDFDVKLIILNFFSKTKEMIHNMSESCLKFWNSFSILHSKSFIFGYKSVLSCSSHICCAFMSDFKHIPDFFCTFAPCSMKRGQFKDASSLKVICFEPIFRKIVILSNLQDVALIPIEKDDETHKPRRGWIDFQNKMYF